MSLTARFPNLSPRFSLVLACLFIGMIALVGFELNAYRHGMTEERKMKARAMVESVVSLVQFYNEKSGKEGFQQEEAQKLALQAIREINNNEKEYFWVTNNKGQMLMHPTHPELEGRDLATLKEPDGHILFFDFLKMTEQNETGFVEYKWSKPGAMSDELSKKITFVARYKPWNWIIGSGIYLDDVNETFKNGIYIAGAMSIAVLLFSIALAVTASETFRK